MKLLVLPRHSSLSDSIEEDCESGAGQSASTEGVDGQLLLLDIEGRAGHLWYSIGHPVDISGGTGVPLCIDRTILQQSSSYSRMSS